MKSIGTMITEIIKKYRKYKRWQSLCFDFETAYHLDLKYLGLYTLACGLENPDDFAKRLWKFTRRSGRNLGRLRKLGYYKNKLKGLTDPDILAIL